MPLIQDIKTTLSRAMADWKASVELRRISGKRLSGDGPLVISVLRNEMLRLPRFFDHYRALGVSEFVIVDNNSTDGTQEYLNSREDVLLYSAHAHFIGKERWVNYLLRRHGRGRWCLVVDADELLEYPDSGSVSLPRLCRYLDGNGFNAVHAILLDLYPEGPLSEIGYKSGEDYFTRSWYFDPFESLIRTPRHFHRGSGLDYRFMGGMRKRVFGVDPCCSKFPLLRYEKGMFLSDGQHYLEGGRFSELRAVLYHFKYLQDFELHVREEVERAQHWGGAVEYRNYAEKMSDGGMNFHFRDGASLQHRDAKMLEECGYLVSPQSYREYVSLMDCGTLR